MHVINLGEQPPAQRFLRPDQLAEPEPMAPLTVFACLDCALIQVPDNVPAGFFTHYLYVSSTSDHLVRHFERLIIQGLALDRHPELLPLYFGNYEKLVYLAQAPDAQLEQQAKAAARHLGLAYEQRPTGYGGLHDFLRKAG